MFTEEYYNEENKEINPLKISEDGPEYTHMVLMTDTMYDNIVPENMYGVLDITIKPLQKLLDYEDILTEYKIVNYPIYLEKELKRKTVKVSYVFGDHVEYNNEDCIVIKQLPGKKVKLIDKSSSILVVSMEEIK